MHFEIDIFRRKTSLYRKSAYVTSSTQKISFIEIACSCTDNCIYRLRVPLQCNYAHQQRVAGLGNEREELCMFNIER